MPGLFTHQSSAAIRFFADNSGFRWSRYVFTNADLIKPSLIGRVFAVGRVTVATVHRRRIAQVVKLGQTCDRIALALHVVVVKKLDGRRARALFQGRVEILSFAGAHPR